MSTKARSLARKTLFLSLRERACAGLRQCSAAAYTKSLGRPISLLSGPIQAANKRKQTVFPQYQRCTYLGNSSSNPESCYSSERTQLTNHKKRARDVSTKECPTQDNLDEHQNQPPAIDNSGIIEEGEEEHRPPTVAVKGSQMKGGNVVWRASRHQLAACHAAVLEQMSANEKSHTAATENKSLHSHAQFKSLGVIEPSKDLDLQLMITNYTLPALAAGLRDREETLQFCARLLEDGNLEQLERVLHPYQAELITRRRRKTRSLDLAGGLTSKHLNMLRKYLQRSPRQLTRAVSLRASVVIPLCNVNGVASVLFERRSPFVRSFKSQVCFPGGMVEESLDVNIIETSLREMEEEIGFPARSVDVLGVLRCDWSEVHKITGIGVTPVVGFLGDLTEKELSPNPKEVAECFTIPLATLLDVEHWNREEEKGTVVFVGGPHVIWGLTAHLLDIFLKDILMRYKVQVQ